MTDQRISAARQVRFIDDSAIDWKQVRRTRCQFYQHFHYEYPGPIHDLHQRLVIIPADCYGTQQLLDRHLVIQPTPLTMRQSTDTFGNRVLELEVAQADRVVSFEALMIVESAALEQYPAVSDAETRHFLQPTPLTMPDSRIRETAQQLRRESADAHHLAQTISDWVYAAMTYQSGVTTVETTAAEALALGQGLCQDYAHVMIALCRSAGLPTRYVSGHLLGEGGSHAWVEVFLPNSSGLSAYAFDPTNRCHPHLGYVTVAVGRDYHDVSPTSGRFTAPYGGQLTCSKHAGLTLVEYLNGDTLESASAS